MERKKVKNPATNAYFVPLDLFIGTIVEVYLIYSQTR